VDAEGKPAGSILPGRVAVAFARPSTAFSTEPARTREVKLVLAAGGAKAVGAGESLGGWKPERGVDSGRMLTLPVGAVLQFKWVRMVADKAEWEQRPDRFVFVEPGDGPLVVESRWGE
jgi:hypothetical protein